VIEECDNGLVDCAVPIIINGKHIASLATGQILLRTPDMDRFKRQAKEFGADEQKYLAALKDIPVVDVDRLKRVTAFLGELAHIVADLGYMNLKSKEESLRLEKEIKTKAKIEEELRWSEQNYKEIFNSTSDAMFIHDEDGNILDANEQACRMFGASRDEITRNNISPGSAGYPPYTIEVAKEKIKSAVSEGSQVFEWRSKKNSGELMWVEVGLRACKLNGHMRIIASVRDIAERKKVEEVLRNEKEKAETANKAKTEFLTNLSHDIRTPLNAMLGFTSILQRQITDAKFRRQLKIMHESGQNLLALVNDILDISRVESGKVLLQPAEFDIYELMDYVVDVAKHEIGDRDLKIEYDVVSDSRRFIGDHVRLKQIFVNLLTNAVKYTDKGKVKVAVRIASPEKGEKNRLVMVSVKDTGFGIPKDKIDRIFEPFSRFHEFEGGRIRKGMGLGLYITKTLIRLMGGDITVTSKVGSGSEFLFTIKLKTVHDGQDAGKKL